MNLETIGSREEKNIFPSFDSFRQDLEKNKNPKKPLKLILDEAIKKNNTESDDKFVKKLSVEQKDIILIKAQELFQSIWGKEKSWRANNELQITKDKKGLYIRVRLNT